MGEWIEINTTHKPGKLLLIHRGSDGQTLAEKTLWNVPPELETELIENAHTTQVIANNMEGGHPEMVSDIIEKTKFYHKDRQAKTIDL